MGSDDRTVRESLAFTDGGIARIDAARVAGPPRTPAAEPASPQGAAALLAFLLALVPPASGQATLLVPGDYPTIQSAIDAAATGDTILVSAGTYLETINFLGKGIVVKSVAGPEATIIDADFADRVVTLDSGEPPTAALSGFTVRNGLSGGAAGIYVASGASPTITGNIVRDNLTCGDGGGIYVASSATRVVGNLITNNQQTGCGGGEGGGLRLIGDCTGALILDNVISTNIHSAGAGIALLNAGSPLIMGNVISGNGAWYFSGGIGWSASSPRLIQNLILDNWAIMGGGGVALSASQSFPQTVVANNTVVGNSCPVGSSLYAPDGLPPSVLVRNNVFVGPPDQSTVFSPSYLGGTSFRNNDVFGPGPVLYGGGMPDLTGLNGNFSANPLFADGGPQGHHLGPNSPCVDAGFNGVTPLPPADLDGDARIYDGDGNGTSTIDVGWDERAPGVRFGAGCAGASGLLPRIGLSGPPPALGNASAAILVTRAAPLTPSILVAALALPPIPIGLSLLGMPNCSLYVDPFLLLVATAGTVGFGPANGTTTTTLPIPNDPALQGQHFYFQAYSADLASALFPGGLTVALDVSIP